MANNAAGALGPIAPGVRTNGTIITPGTVVFNPPLTKLYIGGTGSIVAEMAGTGTVTLTAVPAGSWINDLAIINIGTASATGIIGFW
jgi:hypothetical protein